MDWETIAKEYAHRVRMVWANEQGTNGMLTSREIEKMFIDEIRDKKRVGNGIHSKTGIRGFTGKILTPVDFMTRKEKYNYRKGGKILSYNIHEEQIMENDEFLKLPEERMRELLVIWRNKFTTKEINEKWGWKDYQFYNLMRKLGMESSRPPKKEQVKKEKTKIKKITIDEKQMTATKTDDQKSQESIQVTVLPPQWRAPEGFHLSLDGTYGAQEIINKLMKFVYILEGEECKYKVNLSITEQF